MNIAVKILIDYQLFSICICQESHLNA